MDPPQPLPDEGYTGSDTQSQAPLDELMTSPDSASAKQPADMSASQLFHHALLLPTAQRLHLIHALLPGLRTPDLHLIESQIRSLIYKDPILFLPAELALLIFSHLNPAELLTCSLVSRAWREQTRDERLWRQCFTREGWILDKAKMAAQEDMARRRGPQVAERVMRQPRFSLGLERKSSRKRARDEAFNSETESTAVIVGDGPTADLSDSVDSMEDVIPTAAERAVRSTVPGTVMTAQDALLVFDTQPSTPEDTSPRQFRPFTDPTALQIEPPVFSDTKDPRVSWPYLYKQRRRLERNWETGKYTMFRLPHPNHEDDGHAECVYTIQHSGNHLVSGSRDKTIRIWDLDTYRLKFPPLRGHEASVLCLQFDDKPGDKHDIIVSGGSDHYVIIWKFSTGEIIKKMTSAHKESVLNLRFDDRYLITCSKDKTIKVWNRHAIAHDDPIVPKWVVNRGYFETEIREGISMDPFTLMATMMGHHAAVNAVQISGDTIISASGDRTIKSWNVHEQSFKKSYSGHTKGIACVQYDGRRIVSGSSDNSVRIFDYQTTAEVACLDGHNNLVRTVQARFGDLETITDEELLEESREADKGFLKALEESRETDKEPLKALEASIDPSQVSRRRGPRNAGSNLAEHMLSYGTKIPPGGGGSKWSKIVSGSYDETVIVWKRGKDGKWKPNQRLHQGMLLNPAGSSTRVRPNALPQPINLNNINGQAAQPQHISASQHAQQLLQQAQSQLQQVNSILQRPQLGHTQVLPNSQLTAAQSAQSNLNVQMHALASQQHQHAIQHGAAAVATLGAAAAPNTNGANIQQQPGNVNANTNVNAHTNTQQAQTLQGQPQPQPGQAHGHHHHHHHHHHGNQPNAAQRESNRVFKLQFDTRRIIACSQNKVIVGWDFAAGDKDLEWVGDWSVETP